MTMKENQINKDNLEMESIALDSNVFRNSRFHQFFTHTKRIISKFGYHQLLY